MGISDPSGPLVGMKRVREGRMSKRDVSELEVGRDGRRDMLCLLVVSLQ